MDKLLPYANRWPCTRNCMKRRKNFVLILHMCMKQFQVLPAYIFFALFYLAFFNHALDSIKFWYIFISII